MAITYINGFGTIPVAGDMISYMAPQTGTVTYSRQAGRNGGYSLRNSNSTAGTTNTAAGYRISVAAYTEFSIGFALNHRNVFTAANSNVVLALSPASGATNVYLGTGNANIYPGVASGTTAWTIVDSSVTGIGWHWWNFVFRSSATVGICELYRDGTLLARANGDTVPTSGPFLDWTLTNGNDNGGAQIDIADLVFRNDATVIPDTAVFTLFPDGTSAGALVGSDGDSTNNHLLVNENPTYSAANYVGSATVGATDTYSVANLPAVTGTVTAVQATARVFKSDAGVKTVATMINSAVATAVDPGGGSTFYQLTLTDGGTAWDVTRVNAATVGVRVIS
jgi:hypothetical protein